MCQEYMDHEGRSQQSLVIDTPKFHKRYILPGTLSLSLTLSRVETFWDLRAKIHSLSAGEVMTSTNLDKLKYFGSSLEDEDDWNQFRNGNLIFFVSI